MKRNISISYRTICAGIFVIISIIILAINGISLFKYDNATDYEKSALRPGEYVKFQLMDYLSKPLDKYNSDVSSGQCEVEVTFFGDYYVYNIPYMDNTYVRVLKAKTMFIIKDEANVNKFNLKKEFCGIGFIMFMVYWIISCVGR